MPQPPELTIATYADDTALLSSQKSANLASEILQKGVLEIESWFKKWNIKVNNDKSIHITFTLNKKECPSIALNGSLVPNSNVVKYLGLYLDAKLTWQHHIKVKRQQLNIKTKRMNWLLGHRSELSLYSKLILYKVIIKPVWTYGIELWGTASNSNLEILERFQNKTLRLIVKAPWFVKNSTILRDLDFPTIKQEVNRLSVRYLNRLSYHVNPSAISLLDDSEEINRLKRFHILYLPFRK